MWLREILLSMLQALGYGIIWCEFQEGKKQMREVIS